MFFPPIFLSPGKYQKKSFAVSRANNNKKQADHGLTGGSAFDHDLFPPPLPPPLDQTISFSFTRESVFVSTLRHNARGVRCDSVGEIGMIFAPVVFVSDKNAYGP